MTTAETPDLELLADPAARVDPYPLLHRLRERSPFPLRDGMLVVAGRYRDCAAVLRHPNASSDRHHSLVPTSIPSEGFLSFLYMDPPDHTRLRRLVSAAFTPRVVATLRPRIVEIVDRLLAAVAGQRQLDVVADLAYPLPVQVIGELLGVPPEDGDRLREWSAVLVRSIDPQVVKPDPERVATGVHAMREFDHYFSGLIDQRRDRPGDDLLSSLVHVQSEGDRLSEDELLATCALLLAAGHETTANLLANAVLALTRHPDQLDALRAQPDLVSGAVEEALRYDPPVQMTSRVARGPLPVGDIEVPDRGLVLLLLPAANRDPDEFDDPDRFDISRRPNHLSFAAGIHFCLGAGLSRLEAAVALDAFARRVRAPQLLETALEYKPSYALRGLARLNVGFDTITTG
jgi:cytochrome P450